MKVFIFCLPLFCMAALSMAQYGHGGYHDNHQNGGYPSESSSSSSSNSNSGESNEECNACPGLQLMVGSTSPDADPTIDDEIVDNNGCKTVKVKCDFPASSKGYMMLNDDFRAIVNKHSAEQMIQQKLTCSKSDGWVFVEADGKKIIAKSVSCKAALCDTCSVKNANPEKPIKPNVKFSGLNSNLCRTGTVTCDGTTSDPVMNGFVFFGNSQPDWTFACGNQCVQKVIVNVIPFFCGSDLLKVIAETDKGNFTAEQVSCDYIERRSAK